MRPPTPSHRRVTIRVLHGRHLLWNAYHQQVPGAAAEAWKALGNRTTYKPMVWQPGDKLPQPSGQAYPFQPDNSWHDHGGASSWYVWCWCPNCPPAEKGVKGGERLELPQPDNPDAIWRPPYQPTHITRRWSQPVNEGLFGDEVSHV